MKDIIFNSEIQFLANFYLLFGQTSYYYDSFFL